MYEMGFEIECMFVRIELFYTSHIDDQISHSWSKFDLLRPQAQWSAYM